MRPGVCIDARMAQASGIGTYLQGLLRAFAQKPPPDWSMTLLGDASYLPAGPWRILPAQSSIYSLKEQWLIPRRFHKSGAGLLHAPHYNVPAAVIDRCVVTVHDVIHLKFPQFWPSLAARAYARLFFYHIIPKARRILTVSENTKRDMVDMLSIPAERVTVTYPAVSGDFTPSRRDDRAATATLGLPADYLLYVGNLKEFKNVPRLLDAYRRLRAARPDSPALVLAGRNFIPGFENTMRATPGVIWKGDVARDLLPPLYAGALAFVFPSLYEGFGLPPLEAMASGTPVICSNRASLPEVAGEAAWFVNPESVEDIQNAMATLTDDAALRKSLSAKGIERAARFSWSRTAEQTLEVYRQCLI